MGRSGRRRGDLLRVVVGQAGIAPLEERAQGAIEGSRARLQQKMCTARCLLHLLALGKVLADDGVHRGLGITT